MSATSRRYCRYRRSCGTVPAPGLPHAHPAEHFRPIASATTPGDISATTVAGIDSIVLAGGNYTMTAAQAALANGTTGTQVVTLTTQASGTLAAVLALTAPAHADERRELEQLRATTVGEGGRTVELNTLGAGVLFGELMLSGERRSATVTVQRNTRTAKHLPIR